MKILLFYLGMLSMTSSCFGQDVNEKELLKTYTEQELADIKDESAEKYNLLVYALENGIDIITISTEKENPSRRVIELPEGDFTYADLGLKIEDQNQYYQIKGTNKCIMLKSFWVLEYELKNNSK